ncbi:MAG: PAS domain-containing sensor histidine kinase [Elusimicrobiota bacterium]
MTKKTLITCRDFLKTLGQTIKLMTLYKPDHPVPTSALQECHGYLKAVFEDMQWEEVTYAMREGRWYVNEAVLSESAHIPEILVELFRLQDLHSVTFLKGILLYELAALCELGAIPSNEVKEIAVQDYLKQKGVSHMNTQIIDEYAKSAPRPRPQPAEPAEIESPIPRRQPAAPPPQYRAPAEPAAGYDPGAGYYPPAYGPAGSAGGSASGGGGAAAGSGSGQGFGGLIKNLVERSISDPQERAAFYSEAVRMVKGAIERRVEQSTKHIRLEHHVVLNERARAENVMSGFAGGRVTVDAEGRILMLDPIAEEIIGRRLVDVAGRPVLDCVDDETQIAALAEEMRIPTDRHISKNIRLAGRKSDMRALKNSMAVIQDEQGRVVGTVGVMPHQTKYKEAERREEEFLSHVTHELKAPLSSICSALEILADMAGGRLQKQERKFLDISRRNGARLKSMIDEILDFSKLKAGQLKTELVVTELEPILQEAMEGLQPWAASKKLWLGLDVENLGAARYVVADHGRVVQIVTNLISNAIKSTPADGQIHVSAAPGTGEHEGMAVITVRDTGIGISEENQKRIFERFQQVETKHQHRDGVGLGLSIVKHLITAHKGGLWVESEEKKGAAFFFSLEIAEPADAAA